MITQKEQNYLDNLSPEEAGRIISITPYSSEVHEIAEKVMAKIKSILPDADVRFMGASALKISGQNDIDIYVLTDTLNHPKYLSVLNELFGEQTKHKWHWLEKGYEVSVYLSDAADPDQKRQIDMFELLRSNREILNEYEALKSSMNGKTYREYQTAKYEFYNKILGV